MDELIQSLMKQGGELTLSTKEKQEEPKEQEPSKETQEPKSELEKALQTLPKAGQHMVESIKRDGATDEEILELLRNPFGI